MVRLVDGHQQWTPETARHVHQLVQEAPGEALTVLGRQLGEVQHRRGAQLQQPAAQQSGRAWVGRHITILTGQDVGEALAQRGELALPVEHELLDAPVGLLQQPAQAVRLAAT